MGDFSDMVTLTKQKLRDDPKFTTTIVGRELNQGQIDICKKTAVMDDKVDMDAVASQIEYSYPIVDDNAATITVLKIKYILYYSGGRWEPLTYIPFKEYVKADTTQPGVPTLFYDRPGKKKFGLYPKPPSAGTDVIRVYVVDAPTPMVETSQEDCDLPKVLHIADVFYACKQLAGRDGKLDEMGVWDKEYQRAIHEGEVFLIPDAPQYIREDEAGEELD